MAPGHADEIVARNEHTGLVGTMLSTTKGTLDSIVGIVTKPWIDFKVTSKDVECLAQNIYYESASEPEEGKVAVGIVTINRVKDPKFSGKTICEIVKTRTVFVTKREVEKTEVIKTGLFNKEKIITTKHVVATSVPVCQFSWVCNYVRKPKLSDERWQESQRVARNLLDGEYEQWQVKYSEARYFHATAVRPSWAKQKRKIERIGGHIFYADI